MAISKRLEKTLNLLLEDEVSLMTDEQMGCYLLEIQNGWKKSGKLLKKHSFSESEYYNFNKFAEYLLKSNWKKEEIFDYYYRAMNYSESHGAKYFNWVSVVKAWKHNQSKNTSPEIKKTFIPFGRNEANDHKLKQNAKDFLNNK